MKDASEEHIRSNSNSYAVYLIGFFVSAILTVIPFIIVTNYLVIQPLFNDIFLKIVISICGITQVIFHLIYFLDLNFSFEKRWNLISFVFVVLISLILVIGSLWIMWYLHFNLMNHY